MSSVIGAARARRATPAALPRASRLAVLAQRRDLRRHRRELALRLREVDVGLGVAHRLLGVLLRFVGLRLVEVLAADRRVGEDGDGTRLHLQDAAGDEDELLLAVVGALDAHRARLDAGDERGMARIDAELAHLAGESDEARLARE